MMAGEEIGARESVAALWLQSCWYTTICQWSWSTEERRCWLRPTCTVVSGWVFRLKATYYGLSRFSRHFQM